MIGLWAAALLLTPSLTAAAPVVRLYEEGRINWSEGTLEVNGVGTPEILSPTGARTPDDPYEMARADARRRLERLLARLPVDGRRRLSQVGELDQARSLAVDAFTSEAARRFSDGTVHLPARLPFWWVAQTLAPPLNPGPPLPPDLYAPDPKQKALVVIISGRMRPAVQLQFKAAGQEARAAGLPGDPLGASGVIWRQSLAEVKADPRLGSAPVVVKARPGARAGEVEVPEKAQKAIFAPLDQTDRPGQALIWVVTR